MTYMTEEEADALDEELTRTTPSVDFGKSDVSGPKEPDPSPPFSHQRLKTPVRQT